MNLLLDTCTFLWCLGSPSELTQKAREEIINPLNNVYISSISTWEIAIKQSKGKLKAPKNLEKKISEKNFIPLPVSIGHSFKIAELPSIHNDPFDRMLVAQAMLDKLVIVTRDRFIPEYKIRTLKA